MTRQELIRVYDTMAMPEERAAALQDRLMSLFESKTAAPYDLGEPPREYRGAEKKPSAAKITAAALSTAAAAAVCIVGGKWLLDRLPAAPANPNSPVEVIATEEATAEGTAEPTIEPTAETDSEVLDDSVPLPDLYGAFELRFDLIEPFCYSWCDKETDLAPVIRIDAHEDIFGSVHNWDGELLPDRYCAGFCEDELGWYMRGSNRNGGDSIYYVPKNRRGQMYRYDYGSDAAPARSDYSAVYQQLEKGNPELSDPNNDGSFYASALQYDDREPVKNYVGQISWLGKEMLCAERGARWTEEFIKWYNCGSSITFEGTKYLRTPLLAAGGTAEEDLRGMGRVWVIDHSDTKIIAAFRFTSEDWINYREQLQADKNNTYDISDYPNAYAARYFILTAEYENGEWHERFEPLNQIDAMGLLGEKFPNNYAAGFYDDSYAWGNRSFVAAQFNDGGSELFSYNRVTDEYTLQNRFSYSAYYHLYSDSQLYILGSDENGSEGLFLYKYAIESGALAARNEELAAGEVTHRFFLSGDGKYLFAETKDAEDNRRAYVFETDDLNIAAWGENTAEHTQFSFADACLVITKDGAECSFDY